MTWTGPSLVIQSIKPKRATSASIKKGLAIAVTGTGFDAGAFVVFVPHGSVVSKKVFTASAIESLEMHVISDQKLEFNVKEAKAPQPGAYDALLAQPISHNTGEATVQFAVLENAFEVT